MDDDAFRCEAVQRRHPQVKCASKCVFVGPSLCLHLFFNTTEREFRIANSEAKPVSRIALRDVQSVFPNRNPKFFRMCG
jgi:hypothetical protein